MKKEVDFITDYRQEKEQFCTIEKIPLSKQDLQHFELTKELINAQESQFIIEKNEEKWNNLENIFYPVLCQIAKIQGGRVELKIFSYENIYRLCFLLNHKEVYSIPYEDTCYPENAVKIMSDIILKMVNAKNELHDRN